MSIQKNKNGRRVVPDLPNEQKETYKSVGKWPPPAGITILTEEEPSTNAVMRLLVSL